MIFCFLSVVGKFQMQVLPKSGHAVHEDVPEQVCQLYLGLDVTKPVFGVSD